MYVFRFKFSALAQHFPKKIGVVIFAGVLTSVLLRFVPQPFTSASTAWWDLCQRAWPYEIQMPLVQVVDVDDSSLDRVGGRPWSRRIMTTILDRLPEAGPAVVGFDLKFAGPSRDKHPSTGAEIDEHFAEAIGRLPVVIGFVMTHRRRKWRGDLKGRDRLFPVAGSIR